MSRLESLLVKILKPIIRNERTRYRLNLTWRKWSQMGGMIRNQILLKKYYKIKKKVNGNKGILLPYLEDTFQVLRADGKHHNWEFGYTDYYSQCGQDFFVDFLLNRKSNGVYLDIGGNDPIAINNTYYFERNGWTGLAFEPLKKYSSKWKEQRTVTCLPIALGDKQCTIFFQEATKDYLSRKVGINQLETVNDDEAKTIQTYEVEQRKLCDVLAEYNLHDIDYMSLDVEGMEYEILTGIDWDKDKIKILSIENEDGFETEMKIRKFLHDKGYVYLARMSTDDIFVKKDCFEIPWR